MSSSIHFAGVPTKPDVDRMQSVFGVPDEGRLITYEEIEQVIGCKYRSNRFTSVVNAWRKSLESKHQVILGCDPGKGVYRLNPDDRLDLSGSKLRSGFRSVGKSGRIVAFTERARLSPENQRAADHITRVVSSVKLAIATAAKQIDLPDLSKR